MAQIFNSAKVEVVMSVTGKDNLVKESFSDVKEGATEAQLLDFSELMAGLCDADHTMAYCIGSVSTLYSK